MGVRAGVDVFEGFKLEHVGVGDVTLRVRHGGDGQRVVLLHGHSRTHTTWQRIAPQLAGSSSSPAQICALTI
jgi:pimeloyl-ACP methyl ester carboxylesterase